MNPRLSTLLLAVLASLGFLFQCSPPEGILYALQGEHETFCLLQPDQVNTHAKLRGFVGATMTVTETFFTGKGCGELSHTVVTTGEVTTRGPSAAPGAREIDIVMGATTLTPQSDDVRDVFNGLFLCGFDDFATGVPKDVSGCQAGDIDAPSIGTTIYDIVHYDASGKERLHFGAVAEDDFVTSESARDTTLSAVPYLRKTPDALSPTITWMTPTSGAARAIHATLLPDGRIMFFGQVSPFYIVDSIVFSMTPTPLGDPYPVDHPVDEWTVPLDYDPPGPYDTIYTAVDSLYCAGHTLLSDGRLFVAGGQRFIQQHYPAIYAALLGLPHGTVYDLDQTWTRTPDMKGYGETPLHGPLRWYPTPTRLADSRILVLGGFDFVVYTFGDPEQIVSVASSNLSAEIYDPVADDWTLLSDKDESPPGLLNKDYAHVFLLPQLAANGADVLAIGAAGGPMLLDTTKTGSDAWTEIPAIRPGAPPMAAPSSGASTSLLPIRLLDGEWGYSNGSIFSAGGEHEQSAIHHADVFDPVTGSWLPRIHIGLDRHHPSTVLLPDGRILVMAGWDSHGVPQLDGPTHAGRMQTIDPANGFAMKWGDAVHEEIRGYHTVSLLLPDGRVLLGGGNDDGDAGDEKTHFRYYSPDYLSANARPTITSAPSVLSYGGSFAMDWTHGFPVTEVVLMGLGSMTHSFDMNQRYVQLEITASTGPDASQDGFLTVLAPPDARVAPAGHYLLFALDARRIPSEGVVIRLQ